MLYVTRICAFLSLHASTTTLIYTLSLHDALPISGSTRKVDVPKFNADSAFFFIKNQVDFGPRVPNSKAHRKTGDYLLKKLKEYGAQVVVQEFQQETFDGTRIALRNIIASYFPEKKKRILLTAHWDTRTFADKDK